MLRSRTDETAGGALLVTVKREHLCLQRAVTCAVRVVVGLTEKRAGRALQPLGGERGGQRGQGGGAVEVPSHRRARSGHGSGLRDDEEVSGLGPASRPVHGSGHSPRSAECGGGGLLRPGETSSRRGIHRPAAMVPPSARKERLSTSTTAYFGIAGRDNSGWRPPIIYTELCIVPELVGRSGSAADPPLLSCRPASSRVGSGGLRLCTSLC
jgi:hypothetical protein